MNEENALELNAPVENEELEEVIEDVEETEEVEQQEDTETDETESEPEAKPEKKKISTFFTDDDIKRLRKTNPDFSDRVEERVKQDTKVKYDLQKEIKELSDTSSRKDDEIAELKAKLLEREKPEIAPAPTEDDYYTDADLANQKLQRHIESINAQKEWEGKSQIFQQQTAQQKAEASQRQFKPIEDAFLERAKEIGLNKETVDGYATDLAPIFADKGNVGMGILKHEEGPKILEALHKDVQLQQDMRGMTEFEAGQAIEKLVRSSTKKPKRQSSAPSPDEPLTGTTKLSDQYTGLVNEDGFS